MSYDNIDDLPAAVRDPLPGPAREIYMRAYNAAWDHYKGWDLRRGDASRAEVAQRVAWSAVENDYAKADDGSWHRK